MAPHLRLESGIDPGSRSHLSRTGAEYSSMTNPAKAETTRVVAIEDVDPLSLFGRNDANLRLVERSYPVQLTYRDGKLNVKGEPAAVDEVSAILTTLSDLVRRGAVLEEHDVHNFIGLTD